MDDFQNSNNTNVTNPEQTVPIQPVGPNPTAQKPAEKTPVVSKPVIILAVVVLLAVIGLLGYRYLQSKPSDNPEVILDVIPTEVISGGQAGMPIDPTEENSDDDALPLGNYSDYSLAKLQATQDGKAVLFFAASWCPTCKGLELNIKNNVSQIQDNLAILRVDYDTSSALKQKYGVTYQHTLIQVNSEGTEIKRWFGSPTLSDLQSQVL